MAAPIYVFISGQKETKNGTSARQALGATDLKHRMHTQLDFGSNVSGIIYILICKYDCIYVSWHHGQTLRPKGLKIGMCSPRT